MSIHESCSPDYSPADHQRDGGSQMSTQSANGPNTFDEALVYFEFSVEERRKIAGEAPHGSSPNIQRAPAKPPHPSHLSPQGCSTQPLYYSHSHRAPPAQAIAATHHQGTGYSRFSTAILNRVSASHMIQTVDYSTTSHKPYMHSLSRHYSHQRSYRPHPNPTLHPVSQFQDQAQLQSTEGVQSRWIALQAHAVTWPPDTIEPLDSTGESPLMAFVDRSERKYYCRVPVEGGLCDKENVKKDRILAHIRNDHLHFRPLACGGQCGFVSWLENSTQYYTQTPTELLVFSHMSFPSKSAWTDHVRPRKAICGWWVLPLYLSFLFLSSTTWFSLLVVGSYMHRTSRSIK